MDDAHMFVGFGLCTIPTARRRDLCSQSYPSDVIRLLKISLKFNQNDYK